MAVDRFRKVAEAAASAAINLARPNYFNSSEKGELSEFRNDLNSDNRLVKKEAVKRVIAAMTIGKDVTGLFADVLKCMQTEDVELKKLVYLYLMNNARKQPELVILAVNSFCKDTEDPSPLLRALALRTMACIRVERIADYLCEPLHRTLQDSSPYVRKTAAICVAKLWQLSPDLVEEHGFLEELRGLLGDPNPMVLSTAVAAFVEIDERLRFDGREASRLLKALPECTEWGQATILDALAQAWAPHLSDPEQIAFGAESILPRLQHANPAVVLAAMRVIGILVERQMDDALLRKLAPPLVTLLSSSAPEIQYIALRCARVLLQRHPSLLSSATRVFFAKYSDPAYVKAEKLELLVQLADASNAAQILPELADYAKEVDVDFVRRAIRTLGAIAAKLPDVAAGPAVELLAELAQTDVRYVVQEVLVAARSLLRRQPGCIPGHLLGQLVRPDLALYDDPEARAALLWLIGEHSADLARAEVDCIEILGDVISSFKLELPTVQAELFTAALKLFIREPSQDVKQLMYDLIQQGKACIESIELRDRAILFERLLTLDPGILRSLSLSPSIPPALSATYQAIPQDLLLFLVSQLGSFASIYHKAPKDFVKPVIKEEEAHDLEDDISIDDDGAPIALHPDERPGIPFDLLDDLSDNRPHHTNYQGSLSPQNPPRQNSTPTNLIDLLS